MTVQVSQQQAADAYLKRKLIRSSLAAWAEHCGFTPARHHRMLIEHLEKVARGEIMRLAVFMPPGSAKSTYASILFPSWLMSQDPKAQFLAASHTTELAERWGRRVRNLVTENTAVLRVTLSEEQAVGRWGLAEGGEYMAAGANVGIAGFRAKYGLIDDPIRSRQDADSALVRDRIWDWYLNDFRPRLIPHARQVLIQCLTGDTMISMADGSLKRIDAIVPGERVISWDGAKVVHSKVTATVDNGNDQTYLIRTSGTEIRANARHPFLVLINGGLQWIRTRDLRRGMRIVAQNTAHIKELPAQSMTVPLPRNVAECATSTTQKPSGIQDLDLLHARRQDGWRIAVSGATELMKQLMTACLPIRAAFAPYAELTGALAGQSIGSQISFPTTIIRRENCAASYATIATELPGELEIQKFWNAPSNTSEPVIDVTPCGINRVYDLTVEKTHNFQGNGLWCSNTRWHEDDLAGRCLNHQHWDVLSLPAFAKSDDQLGRSVDEPLWADDDYGYGEQLKSLRDTTPPRIWSALYQQEPTPDEGDYFKEEWIKPVDILPQLSTMRCYGASDYAVTSDGGDYTVHVVFGVDPLNNLYLLDVWRGQKAADIWIDALCDLVQKYRPMAWAEEGGQIKASLGPFIEQRMRARRVYVNRESFPTRGDKSIRARSIQGRMALDGLYYPKRAPWAADWTAELLNFPASKHDDQVDAMGLCGQLLDIMVKGRAGHPPIIKLPKDGYTNALEKRRKTVDAMTL